MRTFKDCISDVGHLGKHHALERYVRTGGMGGFIPFPGSFIGEMKLWISGGRRGRTGVMWLIELGMLFPLAGRGGGSITYSLVNGG